MRQIILIRAVLAVASMVAVSAAMSSPITVSRGYQFLDNVSTNSLGIRAGQRQQFGANCVVLIGNACTPQNSANAIGTSVTATQGSSVLQLSYVASDLTSNHWATAPLPAAVPDGQWLITATNGSDTASALTPDLQGAALMSFASAGAIQQNGVTPSFSWALPQAGPGTSIDAVTVLIRDVTDVRNGVATLIFRAPLAANAMSLQVQANDARFLAGNRLQLGHQYALEIQVQDTRDNTANGAFVNVLSQSRTHLNFSPEAANGQGSVYLPSLDTSGATPVYRFNGVPVQAGRTVLIDPLVALGFDYAIGANDPFFESVTLPTGVGDNLFDLWLWDGAAWNDTGLDLVGGQQHVFGLGGVDRFRILGIEPQAGVDPYAAGNFTTGVSFVADGSFNGTMTPLVAQIPEPRSVGLVLLAVGLLAASRRQARRFAV